jgi:riboflavin kinase/FMN adenylyltransferase
MTVVDWAEFIGAARSRQKNPPAAVTIGAFDGVHRGHQALIKETVSRGPSPAVITFKQNPKSILSPETYPGDIFSLKQKLEYFELLGIERVVLIDFSGNFSKLGGQEFISLLMEKGNLVFLTVGRNFHCGYILDTDAEQIALTGKRFGVHVEALPPVLEGSYPVSSSRIRNAIQAGNMREAACLLGRNLKLDLSGIPQEKAGNYTCFKTASMNRITAAKGAFPVLLYGKNSSAGKRVEVFTENGDVFIPGGGDPPLNVETIEFLIN